MLKQLTHMCSASSWFIAHRTYCRLHGNMTRSFRVQIIQAILLTTIVLAINLALPVPGLPIMLTYIFLEMLFFLKRLTDVNRYLCDKAALTC